MNRPLALAFLVVTLAVAACLLGPARPGRAEVSSFAPKMKALQARLLREEMRERTERLREARRARGRSGSRARAPRIEGVETRAGIAGAVRAPASPMSAQAGAALGTNVRANNPGAEAPGIGQAEVYLAADGNNVLVGWNDGQGFVVSGDIQGYAYSTDGGASFTDGGSPPKLANWRWTSDPLVFVNRTTHEFFYCALIDINGTAQNGIGIVKATFSGGSVSWGTPVVVVSGLSSTYFYDKPWLGVDATLGTLHCVYTKFTASGDQIEHTRSTNGGVNWSVPVALSNTGAPPGGENGLVQGARVVANNSTVYAAYYSAGLVDVDALKVRKSTDGGATWAAPVIAQSFYSNYSSGAPGFNRTNGLAFPGMALDVGGSHPGRVYLTWPESVNYFADNLGTGTVRGEIEANDTPGTATSFTMGQELHGEVGISNDFLDYWSFTGTRGQTVIVFADSVNSSLDGWLRLYCSDGTQRLALSAPGPGYTIGGLMVFTLPVNGTYVMRIAANSGAGQYRLQTGIHSPQGTDRARDHRDVMVSWSDTGLNGSWSAPVRVNNDPAWFDDWLPEIAVDAAGRAYVAWYDWRDSPAGTCGAWSHVYLAYSEDGGANWNARGAVTDTPSDWTAVLSNIAPNQGDYLGLYANATDVYVAWSDGRSAGGAGTSPDVWTSRLPISVVPATVSLVSATAEPGRVRVRWSASSEVGWATVYRQPAGGTWEPRGTRAPDGDGFITVEDTDVTPGTRYGYRLGVVEPAGTETFLGETWVDVPSALALAITRVGPNPAERELRVTFTLPGAAGARLELLDVTGRQVRSREVGGLGAGSHTVDLGAGDPLPPGVYLVRLVQGERVVTRRASVVR